MGCDVPDWRRIVVGSFYQVEIQKMTNLTPDFRVFRVEKLRKLCIFDLFQCLGVFSSLVFKRHNCKDYLAETPDVQSRLLFSYCEGVLLTRS